ncbi:MAG: glucose-6-phosphate isomerase family protein [Pseudomonadota bacterium]
MLDPEIIHFAPGSGALAPETGRYTRHLSDLKGLFADAAACDALLRVADPLVYEVREYRQPGADLFCGTTTMQPGRVGAEYFMTRGHYHARPDLGEVYVTQSGSGLLLLENSQGETRQVEMHPSSIAFIPPGWGHRSINTGSMPLVFLWVLNGDAGTDYARIAAFGMRQIVVDMEGPRILPNPHARDPGRSPLL